MNIFHPFEIKINAKLLLITQRDSKEKKFQRVFSIITWKSK